MTAKAGYLATASGIPLDNGSVPVCVRTMPCFTEGRAFLNGL